MDKKKAAIKVAFFVWVYFIFFFIFGIIFNSD